jgi:hypothetical protein
MRGIELKIKKVGAWAKLPEQVAALEDAFEHTDDVLQEVAQIYYDSIFETIMSGNQGAWPPLTKEWVARKGSNAFYYETGEFYDAIKVQWVENTPDGTKRIFVGIDPNEPHHSGKTADAIAGILEEEYNRPLFEPAYARVEQEIKEKLVRIRRKY